MIPTPTPTPAPIPLLADTRWLVATALGAGGILIGLGNFCWKLWTDRRKLTVEVRWDWQNYADQSLPRAKVVGVQVANLQAKPITMNVLITYRHTDRIDVLFSEWYKLFESDWKQTYRNVPEYEQVKAIYAKDTYGKRWHVPRRQLRSVRSKTAEPTR